MNFNGSPVTAIVLTAFVLCSPPRPTMAEIHAQDRGLLATVDSLVAAMNASNDAAIAALLTPDAVIQDEVPPYRWLGPNAEAKWAHDDGRLIAERGVTQSHTARGTPVFVHRSGGRAFMTVPLTYTYTLHQRRQRETGFWTIVLAKDGTTWRVNFLGFAKNSDTSDATWNGN